jgi:beta-N-acetylhexosaminidase
MRIRPVLAGATVLSLAAIGMQATASAAPPPDPVKARLAQLTLEQKVGQLFSTYVYGDSATAPSAADAAQNRALYGVDTGAQVIAKYHLGSVIYSPGPTA